MELYIDALSSIVFESPYEVLHKKCIGIDGQGMLFQGDWNLLRLTENLCVYKYIYRIFLFYLVFMILATNSYINLVHILICKYIFF